MHGMAQSLKCLGSATALICSEAQPQRIGSRHVPAQSLTEEQWNRYPTSCWIQRDLVATKK